MRNRTWRALLWDKDGTLVNSFEPWVQIEKILAQVLVRQFAPSLDAEEYTRTVLRGLGVDLQGRVSATSKLATASQTVLLDVFYQALGTRNLGKPTLLEFQAFADRWIETHLREHPFEVCVQPGALTVVERLWHARVPQGLATADSLVHSRRDLKAIGISEMIAFWACGDQALRPKPDPWSVIAFAEQVGVRAEEVLVVGDTPHDAEMARTSGAGFVGLLCGASRRSEFAPGTLCFDHPQAIPLLANRHSFIVTA